MPEAKSYFLVNGVMSLATKTAGGCVNFPSVGDNPQYFLRVLDGNEPIELEFEQKPHKGADLFGIGIIVANKDGERLHLLYKGDKVADSGPYINNAVVKCVCTLPAREVPYTVVLTTFNPGEECGYVLTASSNADFELWEAVAGGEADRFKHKLVFNGEWKGETAGGSSNHESVKYNPNYFLRTTEPTTVLIMLTQKTAADKRYAISWLLVDKQGGRLEELYKGDTKASSGTYTNKETVIGEFEVPATTYPLTIVCTTFNPGEEAEFTLTLASDKPLDAWQAPNHGVTIKMEDSVSSAYAVKRGAHGFTFLMNCVHHPPTEPSMFYKSVITRCQNQGAKWIDPGFPPQADWGRLSEMSVKFLPDGTKPQPVLFDSIDPDDVVQGSLGDCWLLSALSGVAGRDRAILDLFVEDATSPYGIYALWFYSTDGWEEVVVDDFVPMLDGRPKYASSDESHEMWPAIFEKAYAKWLGGYPAIVGGQPTDAFVNLTGGVAEILHFTHDSADTIWNTLTGYHESEYMLACGSKAGSDTNANEDGIVDGHAYTILNLKTYKDHRLLHIRNPHGGNEWTGAWSDKDLDSWTPEAKIALEHKDEDDGEFYMPVEDFVANYNTVHVCKVFDRAKWTLQQTRGHFLDSSNLANAPQYFLKVLVDTRIVVSIRQEESSRAIKVPAFNFDIYDNNGMRVEARGTNTLFPPRPYEAAREVSWEGVVPASDTPYTIIVRTHEQRVRNKFLLRVFAKTNKPGVVELVDGDRITAHSAPVSVEDVSLSVNESKGAMSHSPSPLGPSASSSSPAATSASPSSPAATSGGAPASSSVSGPPVAPQNTAATAGSSQASSAGTASTTSASTSPAPTTTTPPPTSTTTTTATTNTKAEASSSPSHSTASSVEGSAAGAGTGKGESSPAPSATTSGTTTTSSTTPTKGTAAASEQKAGGKKGGGGCCCVLM